MGTEWVMLPGNLSGAHSGAGIELNIKHGGLRSEGPSSDELKSGFSCGGKDPAIGTGFTVGETEFKQDRGGRPHKSGGRRRSWRSMRSGSGTGVRDWFGTIEAGGP
jgi:hypothetical protein